MNVLLHPCFQTHPSIIYMVGSLIHLQMIDFPLFPMKPPVQATNFQTRPQKNRWIGYMSIVDGWPPL